MAIHILDFHPDAYRGAHITFGQPGESVLCLHFAGNKTADEVLKTLALAIFENQAPNAQVPEEAFDEQPPPAWEDTFAKQQQAFAGVDPEVSSVVRALEADSAPPEPMPGPVVSGAEVPSMREMLELMQGKFGPGGEPPS